MPILMNETMEELRTASNYKFSAVRVDELGATKYTLATIVVDVSGSVAAYQQELENSLITILQSCQKSPMAENLLIRLLSFNDNCDEIHGFKLLSEVAENDYKNLLNPCGGTALFDATHSAIEATRDYGRILVDQDFLANAIVFVITDGADNSSSVNASSIKTVINQTIKDELLESMSVILIGISSNDSSVANYLDTFKQEANITQFIDIGDATPSKLAKMAQFISRSISSTSQSLGSGSASGPLAF
jgi:uncharacterized protein YegL